MCSRRLPHKIGEKEKAIMESGFRWFKRERPGTDPMFSLDIHGISRQRWRKRVFWRTVVVRHPGAGVFAHSVHRASRHREKGDRKSTRLNSSHVKISYAVFCL